MIKANIELWYLMYMNMVPSTVEVPYTTWLFLATDLWWNCVRQCQDVRRYDWQLSCAWVYGNTPMCPVGTAAAGRHGGTVVSLSLCGALGGTMFTQEMQTLFLLLVHKYCTLFNRMCTVLFLIQITNWQLQIPLFHSMLKFVIYFKLKWWLIFSHIYHIFK